MASNKQSGCAIVITVNRVQETHQNGFDDSMLTDIYSLDKLYNDEDNTLDIDKIAAMDNHMIHVGAEYFVLRKMAKGYSLKSIKFQKKKVRELTNKLTRFPKRVYRHFERRSYEKGRYAGKLRILNTDETLALMENEKISFLRYGDGEIAIMQEAPYLSRSMTRSLPGVSESCWGQMLTGLGLGFRITICIL